MIKGTQEIIATKEIFGYLGPMKRIYRHPQYETSVAARLFSAAINLTYRTIGLCAILLILIVSPYCIGLICGLVVSGCADALRLVPNLVK